MATWDTPQTVPEDAANLRPLWLRHITRYKTLADDLRTKIENGQIKPGREPLKLSTLAKDYECSRRTAGRALQTLASEGVVHLFPGMGYYVVRHQ